MRIQLSALALLLIAAPAQAAYIGAIKIDWAPSGPTLTGEYRFQTSETGYLSWALPATVGVDLPIDTPNLQQLVADMTDGVPQTVTISIPGASYEYAESFFTLPLAQVTTDGIITRDHAEDRPGSMGDWHGLIIDELRLNGGRSIANGDGTYRASVHLTILGRIPEPSTLGLAVWLGALGITRRCLPRH